MEGLTVTLIEEGGKARRLIRLPCVPQIGSTIIDGWDGTRFIVSGVEFHERSGGHPDAELVLTSEIWLLVMKG